MRSGKPFDIQFVKLDIERGTGGEIRNYTQVRVLTEDNMNQAPKKTTVRTDRAKFKYPGNEDSTINIYVPELPDRKERRMTVHLRLITQLNGDTVL